MNFKKWVKSIQTAVIMARVWYIEIPPNILCVKCHCKQSQTIIKSKEPNCKTGNTTKILEINLSKITISCLHNAHAPAKFSRFRDYYNHSVKLSGYLKTFLKVSKSRKQFIVSSILPKMNETH